MSLLQVCHRVAASCPHAAAISRPRESRSGATIAKDRKDSPRKIDLAIAAIVAHDRATHDEPRGSIYDHRDVVEV